MKILLIVLCTVVALPIGALVGLFIIGCIVDKGTDKAAPTPNSSAAPVSADAPIAVVPPPTIAPDPNGLQSPDKDTRQIAASRMGETGRASDCDALLAALQTETDWTVRASIVTGLGKQYYQSPDVRALGADRLLLPIAKELKSDEIGLRLSAMRALQNIGDKRAGRFLLPLLRDPDAKIREQAVTAAGAMRSVETVPALLEILKTPSDGTVEGRFSRVWATNALARIGDARAVEPLIAQLHDNDVTFSSSAATALGRLGDKRAMAPLRGLLSDTSAERRFDAVVALARLRDRDALPQLEQMARRDKTYVNGRHLNDIAQRAIRYIQTGRGKVDEYD